MFYLTAAEIQRHITEVWVTAEPQQQGPAHTGKQTLTTERSIINKYFTV